jgi:hypothetical protein
MVWLVYPSNDSCTELFGIQEAESAGTVASPPLLLFEIARVLMRFDHVATFITNANHGIV